MVLLHLQATNTILTEVFLAYNPFDEQGDQLYNVGNVVVLVAFTVNELVLL